ncbi:hypothetical protein H5T88_08485 [bacterium]|nr:hypothetical protein [bacterium]
MPAYGGLASIDIGFSANSFHSEVITSLSLRAFCFAKGVAISYLIVAKK